MRTTFWIPLVIAGLISACGSPVRLDNSAQPAQIERRGGDAGAAGQGTDANATSQGLNTADRQVASVEAPVVAPDPLTDTDSLLAKRSVFFDYDSFTIREEFRPIVEAHARFLVSNTDRRVVLQGNTDERGSREYNLALGQKRAEAVRRALTILGVNDAQLEAISFGEERPRAVSQTEDAYAENRRTDIVYQ